MKITKKTSRLLMAGITLCISTFLVISCSTEPLDNEDINNETASNLGAKNPLANVTTSNAWHDSFSVNGKCYCKSTYDHGVGTIKVGDKTVREICEAMKAEMQKALNGPGQKTFYNTVQCGHEPAHTDKTIQGQPDEVLCPGEVGPGIKCNSRKGPKWDGSSTPPPNPTPTPGGGPAGYTYAAVERTTVNVQGTVNIAYGANGKFFYKRNVSTNTPCNNSVFGDPIPGVLKRCYIKSVSGSNPTPPSSGNEINMSFASPAAGTQLKAGYKNFYVKANVAPKRGRSIQQVKLYIDGRFIRTERKDPYEWGGAQRSKETEGLSPGAHTLKVEALDSAGEKNSITTQITITQ